MNFIDFLPKEIQHRENFIINTTQSRKEKIKIMPRFFQHIQKGENNLGKVTRLKYIDDISDPDMVLYYFEDGSYCNSEFICQFDEQNPMQSQKAMIEIPSPTSTWKFKKRERLIDLNVEEGKNKAIGQDGVIYEAPSFAELTGMKESSKDEYDVERSARIPKNFKPEEDELYMLSKHPELEQTATTPIADTSVSTAATSSKPTMVIKKRTPEATAQPAAPVEQKAASSSTLSCSFRKGNTYSIVTEDGAVSLTYDEIVEKLLLNNEVEALKKKIKELESRPATNVSSKYLENEDVLIKNMIDKSKRKTCQITMKVKLELPPKELYDTIKLVYDDTLAEQFVSSMTARIPQEDLLASLNRGLVNYYTTIGTSAKKSSPKTQPETPEESNK